MRWMRLGGWKKRCPVSAGRWKSSRDYTYAHSNLGSALKALGRFKEAEKCFRRAVEITPDLADCTTTWGWCWMISGGLKKRWKVIALH
ncbi:MAG: tetratricopeptide repeat protein [Nitrosomonadales bacterium]